MISPALCRKGGALRHEAGIPGAAAEAAGAKRYNAKDAGGVLGTFPGINRHEARARVRVCARTLERGVYVPMFRAYCYITRARNAA